MGDLHNDLMFMDQVLDGRAPPMSHVRINGVQYTVPTIYLTRIEELQAKVDGYKSMLGDWRMVARVKDEQYTRMTEIYEDILTQLQRKVISSD